MNRIAIAGLSIHRTDVAGLQRVRRPEPGRADAFLRELADELGASELVLLVTCNRVEVIYAREEGDLPDERDVDTLARCLALPPDGALDGAARRAAHASAAEALRPMLQLRTGREAALHLFRVASSLDSLVLGEDQILAQVRAAYGDASDIGLVGPLLGPLFHHALAVGKQVRSDTDLARHPVSIVNLAVHALLERPDAASLRVAVVGAGEMGRLLVRALCAAGMRPAVVANRTPAAARLLAADCGARAASLEELRRGGAEVDALVSATAAPGVVLDGPALAALAARAPSGLPLLAIDLAVPRDLPAVDDPRVRVVDLDALRGQAERHRALRAEAAALAERIVEHKADSFCRRLNERAAAEAVSELQSVSDELLGRELSGLLTGRLAHLAEEDRRAVERWARATFGRLMHLPVAALKRLAHDIAAAEPPEGADAAPADGAAPDAAAAWREQDTLEAARERGVRDDDDLREDEALRDLSLRVPRRDAAPADGPRSPEPEP